MIERPGIACGRREQMIGKEMDLFEVLVLKFKRQFSFVSFDFNIAEVVCFLISKNTIALTSSLPLYSPFLPFSFSVETARNFICWLNTPKKLWRLSLI